MQKNYGFTLIELSVVLVIIGLIIGGVMMGKDLIESSQLRQDMSKLEQYSAAVNTFKLKYNSIPGDVANASQFGFDSNAYGNGDGKIQGVISSYSTAYTSVPSAGLRPEWFYVLHHLGRAGLVDSSGDYAITAGVDPLTTGVHFPKMATNIAQGDVGQGATPGFILAYEQNNRVAGHFFRLGAVPFYASKNYLAFYGGFIPSIAKRVDNKFDDGLPVSGRIQIAPLYPLCSEDVYETAGQCAQGSISTTGTWLHCALLSTEDYDQSQPYRTCALRVKAGF